MAGEYGRCNFPGLIFLFLALIQFWSNEFADAGISAIKKTIKSSDGDVIDCVDIYKQPAFNDPLLKNHKILLKHSSYLRGLEARNSSTKIFQSWHKDGECPKGTIPILRTPKIFGPPRRVAPPTTPQSNEQFEGSFPPAIDPPKEFAMVYLPQGNYIGARASLNVWIPKVADAPSEYSLSQMRLSTGGASTLNLIQVGWQVKTGDNKARLFILWTRDNFASTGCYNLHCPGFVQTSRSLVLGGVLSPISIRGGTQSRFTVTIKKDQKTGDWILLFNEEYVGYWPGSIFTNLATAATTVSFGGEVSNTEPNGNHTTTQMGSGHFADEGFGQASYISHIGYIVNGTVFQDADFLVPFITSDACYDLSINSTPQLGFGTHIYFGGPGLSPDCQ